MNDSENMDFLAEPQEPQVEPVLQPEIVEPAAISPAVIEQEAVEPVAIEEPVLIETPMEEVAVEEAEQLEAQPKEQVESEEDLLKKIAALEKEVAALVDSASDSDRRMEIEGDNLEEAVRVQEEFNDWVTKRRASYAWQLLSKLEGHRTNLEADEKLIRDFSSNPPVMEEGFGETTRKWFMKHFWINFTTTWSIVGILLLINKYSDQLNSFLVSQFNWPPSLQYGFSDFLVQKIGMSLSQLITWIFALSFGSFVGLLFAYSRRNSEYLQQVAEENARTNAMEKGIYQVREARERIDSLHPQVPQILEVLSLGLHQPWVIDNDSLLFRGSVPDTTKLPSCVEVAVPTIDSRSPKYEELVFRSMNKIQIPGWRSEAYGEILQKLAESIGFGNNGMALRELDEDHRKTGKRQLVITAGKNPAPSTIIGHTRVEALTRSVQEAVLPIAQPDVISLRPDPLDGLQLDGSIGTSSNVAISKWEEKLAEIADLAAPWSVSTFSNKGTAANRHERVESIFIASEHVNAKEGVSKTSAVNPGARPFEVAIRVDLSEWCKPDEVAIFSDFKPTPEQAERWEQGGSTHGQSLIAEGQANQAPAAEEHLVL